MAMDVTIAIAIDTEMLSTMLLQRPQRGCPEGQPPQVLGRGIMASMERDTNSLMVWAEIQVEGDMDSMRGLGGTQVALTTLRSTLAQA